MAVATLPETEVRYVASADVLVETTLGRLNAGRLVTGRPVRAVRSHAGQRHYCGLFWSATTGEHVVYESRLELDRLWLAADLPHRDRGLARCRANGILINGVHERVTATDASSPSDELHPDHDPVSSRGDDMTAMIGEPVMLAPDGGRLITGGAVHARLLDAHDHPAYASTFEMTVAPGFDVGAHVHHNGEEMFYVIDGELDVLCFEPTDRTPPDWHTWTDPAGRPFLRGRPGAFMYVPPGVPHAFANPTDRPVTMLFQSSVAGGHENYFTELGALLAQSLGHPDPGAVQQLEARYGTEQLTAMLPGGNPRVDVAPALPSDPG